MSVSSNTLFHFTSNFENLLNILDNYFKPHYSLEDFNVVFPGEPQDYLELAIPMVSFCDIPLSQASGHLSTYGSYGIGMTKEWGKKQGITPVLYTHGESLLADCIRDIIKKTEKLVDDRKFLSDLMRFIKPYSGSLWRENGIKNDIIFYNEREWRYMPVGHELFLQKDDFLNKDKREKYNGELAVKYAISFVPDDIRYIVVKNEDEIVPLVDHLLVLGKERKFSMAEGEKLVTRIITSERIKEDF